LVFIAETKKGKKSTNFKVARMKTRVEWYISQESMTPKLEEKFP
jgi:hypothetical protein